MLGAEWVMWVLVGLSVFSFAVIFERLRNLRNQERLGALLWKEKVDGWMSSGVRPELSATTEQMSASYPCLEGALIDVIAKQDSSADRQELELVSTSFLGRKKLELEKHMAFLGTIGSNAPFIGLFGTVLGIIKVFHDLGGRVDTSGTQTISAGISEALIATAIGLLVAIPAVVAFNYFQRKIKMIMGRAESLSNYLISLRG
jgi:biopolymer transport protein ExbB